MFTTYRQQTLFSEEAPAKNSQSLEMERVSQAKDTSGLKCFELSEPINRESSFTKMLEEEFQKDFSTKYLTTWKVRVTKLRHSYSLLVYSVRPTNVIECSILGYWPTPTASDEMNRSPSKNAVMTSTGSIRHQNEVGEQSFMRLSQVVKMWSTPQSRDFTNPSNPTDGRMKRKLSQGWTIDLNDQVVLWNTVKSSDWKHMTMSPSEAARDSITSDLMAIGTTMGYLNPAWEELLMGLPVGYLDLTRLQTFRVSPQVRATINIRMSRRAQRQKRASMRKNASKRLGTRLFGSRHRR